MPDGKKVPKPGPAKLSKNADVDEWLEKAMQNKYLPEPVMKKLCEICKEYLMEGMCWSELDLNFAHQLSRVKYPTSVHSGNSLR